MGDLAESAFEQWAPTQGIIFEAYGLRRPPFKNFQSLSATIRHTPDYLCELPKADVEWLTNNNGKCVRHLLVEVKGCGKEQLLKLKEAEFTEMQRWQAFTDRPLVIFVYDQYNSRVSFNLTTAKVHEHIVKAEIDFYHDGGPPKKYWKIPTEWLDWQPLAEAV